MSILDAWKKWVGREDLVPGIQEEKEEAQETQKETHLPQGKPIAAEKPPERIRERPPTRQEEFLRIVPRNRFGTTRAELYRMQRR